MNLLKKLIIILLILIPISVFSQAPGENVYYEGEIYSNVLIGNQYWLDRNLNVGTQITNWYGNVPPQTDNNILEKYCYDNDTSMCDTYGGLYSWNEAHRWSFTETQGICPTGWHIPSQPEWGMLMMQVPPPGNYAYLVDGGLESGFDALKGGYANNTGGFYQADVSGVWHLSTHPNTFQSYRARVSTSWSIDIFEMSANYSIRCIRDNITDTVPMAIDVTTRPVKCNGDNSGQVLLETAGFSNPTIEWSNGATTDDLLYASAGTYYVSVTQGTFQFIGTGIVTEPTELEIQFTKTDVSCEDGSDGSIHGEGSGGIAPYSYLWSNGSVLQTINNIETGMYYLTITDDNECEFVDSIVVENTSVNFVVNSTVIDVLCYDDNSGSISLDVTPSGSYTYNWDPSSSVSQSLNNCQAGTYYITITSTTNECMRVTIEVIQPDELIVTSDITHTSTVTGNDGYIDISVSGGVPPYEYLWNNGDTIEDINNLVIGDYILTLTDSNGCINITTNEVESYDLYATNVYTQDVSEYYLSDGYVYIQLNSPGGVTYTLSSIDTTYSQSSSFFDNLPENTYDFTCVKGTQILLIEDVVIGYETTTQSIIIDAGWSIISTYLYTGSDDIADIVSDLDVIIVRDESGNVYWPSFGYNQIGELTLGKGYQIKNYNDDTLIVTGASIDPNITPITIPQGWSIIAYFLDYPTLLVDNFSNIMYNVSIIKDGDGNVFWPNYGFDGIEVMRPGEGYQIKMLYTDILWYDTYTPPFNSSE